MRDAATLLRVLFGANIKWISTRCGAGWSRARSSAMRVIAAATRSSALPHVRVCDTARKKIVSRSLEPGRNSSMISRARTRACARRRVHPGRLALPWSSAAKRLVHNLIGPRRIDVATEGRSILVRHGEHCQQTLEGREIPIVHGCSHRLLHQMVARDESRVSRTHRRPALVRLSTLLCEPMAPSSRCAPRQMKRSRVAAPH